MSEDYDELKELLAPLRAMPPRPVGSEHLAPEELHQYHCGLHSTNEEPHIQEHLVGCRDCAQLLLDLSAFPELDCTDAGRLSDAEVSARWALARERLFGAAAQSAPAYDEISRPRWASGTRAPFLPYAVAASLLIAVSALGWWALTLRRDNQRLGEQAREAARGAARLREQQVAGGQASADNNLTLPGTGREAERRDEERAGTGRRWGRGEVAPARQPRAPRPAPPRSAAQIDGEIAGNVAPAELYPDEVLRGEQPDLKTIEAPASSTHLAFTLNTTADGDHPSYMLEVVDQAGVTVWSGRPQRKQDGGSFYVVVPRRHLRAGAYKLRLHGVNHRNREKLEEYSVRVQYR